VPLSDDRSVSTRIPSAPISGITFCLPLRRSRWCHLRRRPSGGVPEAQSAVAQGHVPNVRHSQPRPRDHSARSRLTSDVPSTLTLEKDRPYQGSLPLTRVAHRFRHRRSRPTRRSIAVFPASSRIAGWPCQLRARSVTCIRTPQLRHGWIKNNGCLSYKEWQAAVSGDSVPSRAKPPSASSGSVVRWTSWCRRPATDVPIWGQSRRRKRRRYVASFCGDRRGADRQLCAL
jgi:hypothetical protein